jgi:hypothetical protein
VVSVNSRGYYEEELMHAAVMDICKRKTALSDLGTIDFCRSQFYLALTENTWL